VDSVKDAHHARHPKNAISAKKVVKVNATDTRFTTRYTAKCVGISVGATHNILRRDLKMKRISARWIPHLLTKEQTFARVRVSNSSQNITTDLLQISSLDSLLWINKKMWATKESQRPCIAKRTMSVKKRSCM
jgi:histone-lysine N-methyltransferase SETMAR